MGNQIDEAQAGHAELLAKLGAALTDAQRTSQAQPVTLQQHDALAVYRWLKVMKTAVPDSAPAPAKTPTDTVRFNYLLDNPEASKHLFTLLFKGKGSRDDFTTMLDRIITSRADTDRRLSNGGQK